MRFLIILLAVILFGAELRISSKKFEYNSKNLISIFIGDVNATKGEDTILSDKLYIYFTKDKKPFKFEAIGHVRFKFKDENVTYVGHCNELIYLLKKGLITLKGDAFVRKVETNESVSGDFIKINRFTQNVVVLGGKKPVNIIIKVE